MELYKDYYNDLMLFHIFVITTSVYGKDNLDLYNDVEMGSIYSVPVPMLIPDANVTPFDGIYYFFSLQTFTFIHLQNFRLL